METRTNLLKNGNIKSCGCKRFKNNTKEGIIESEYKKYKSHCKSDEILFDLSLEQYMSIITSNCSYCNCKPNREIGNAIITTKVNGIDRFDNLQGYTIENSIPSCYYCNKMKLDKSYEEFIEQVKKIYEASVMSN